MGGCAGVVVARQPITPFHFSHLGTPHLPPNPAGLPSQPLQSPLQVLQQQVAEYNAKLAAGGRPVELGFLEGCDVLGGGTLIELYCCTALLYYASESGVPGWLRRAGRRYAAPQGCTTLHAAMCCLQCSASRRDAGCWNAGLGLLCTSGRPVLCMHALPCCACRPSMLCALCSHTHADARVDETAAACAGADYCVFFLGSSMRNLARVEQV